jgi:DNA invertase Pin-like site-specific DNA recombinase
MTTIVGYARVSTSDQDLSIQEEKLRAAGCTILRSEKVAGTSTEGRKELRSTIEFLRAGDTLVVTRIDRLARSIRDLQNIVHDLRERGVILRATEQPIDTSTAAGKCFLDMLGVFAEFETNLRRERQLEGIAKAKAEGVYRGRKPSIDAEACPQLACCRQGGDRDCQADGHPSDERVPRARRGGERPEPFARAGVRATQRGRQGQLSKAAPVVACSQLAAFRQASSDSCTRWARTFCTHLCWSRARRDPGHPSRPPPRKEIGSGVCVIAPSGGVKLCVDWADVAFWTAGKSARAFLDIASGISLARQKSPSAPPADGSHCQGLEAGQ